jgi:NADH-quinone oxidoreductase subunit L
VLVLLILSAFLTAFYMGRQVLMVFFGATRTRAAGAASENGPLIVIPLVVLALLSFFGGGLNLPGVHTLGTWLEHTLEGIQEAEFEPVLAAVALGVALLGLLIAWMVYGRRPAARPQVADPLQASYPQVIKPLARKWWVDEIYENTVVRGYKALSAFLAGPVDQGLIDGIVNGMGYLSQTFSGLLRQLQTGFVRSYALMVVVGVVAILGYLIFWQMR